jgi:hypothetical protein
LASRQIGSNFYLFPLNHADHPNEPKGMREVLKEQGLYPAGLRRKCKKCLLDDLLQNNTHNSLTSWLKNLLHKRLLKLWAISVFSCPNSTVNCCELNFIEFFLGAVKKYLRDNCDYTFDMLVGGSIQCIIGWMCIGEDSRLKQHNCRSGSSAQLSTSLIVMSHSLL